jgi:hypothetical protein
MAGSYRHVVVLYQTDEKISKLIQIAQEIQAESPLGKPLQEIFNNSGFGRFLLMPCFKERIP